MSGGGTVVWSREAPLPANVQRLWGRLKAPGFPGRGILQGSPHGITDYSVHKSSFWMKLFY